MNFKTENLPHKLCCVDKQIHSETDLMLWPESKWKIGKSSVFSEKFVYIALVYRCLQTSTQVFYIFVYDI